MTNPVMRAQSVRVDKQSAGAFLRALQRLVRTAPRAQALSKETIEQLASLKPAELNAKMGAVNAHLHAILKLFEGEARASSPQSRQREAARSNIRALIAEGELLPSARFAEQLGVTRQALSKAVVAERLFFLELGAERYFPAFFLDPIYERRQLEQISKCLGELPGASKLQFFSTQKASLGGQSPLQALAQGKFFKVKATATGFAER
jgi:hypothetical protein